MIKWSSSLAVGHPTIDTQHEELVGRLGKLVQAMGRGDRGEIGRLLDFLGSYVVEHFGEEERLMRASAFSGRLLHEAAHAAFVREYEALRKAFAQHGPSAAVTIKVKTWIGEWLVGHISATDQVLAEHLRRRAA